MTGLKVKQDCQLDRENTQGPEQGFFKTAANADLAIRGVYS